MEKFINNYCIVRGDRSGAFFGIVKSVNGQQVEMENVRRLYYWSGACSLSQVAVDGTTEPENCQFTITVGNVVLLDGIEINLCTEKAIKVIKGIKEWKK